MLNIMYIGLKYDDLVSEESELVQEALRRFEIAEPRAAYDRAYRIRVAQQCSLTHTLLPKEQWVKPEEVIYTLNTKNQNSQRYLKIGQEISSTLYQPSCCWTCWTWSFWQHQGYSSPLDALFWTQKNIIKRDILDINMYTHTNTDTLLCSYYD